MKVQLPEPARWTVVVPLLGGAATVAAAEVALLTHDFSVHFVAENGSRATSAYYTFTSLWAAHDGSLLLWVLIITGYLCVVGLRRRCAVSPATRRWAVSVLAASTAFFCGLALFTGQVFDSVSPVPHDGPGPNPLLSDHPAMGIHPPLLYPGSSGPSCRSPSPWRRSSAGRSAGRGSTPSGPTPCGAGRR